MAYSLPAHKEGIKRFLEASLDKMVHKAGISDEEARTVLLEATLEVVKNYKKRSRES